MGFDFAQDRHQLFLLTLFSLFLITVPASYASNYKWSNITIKPRENKILTGQNFTVDVYVELNGTVELTGVKTNLNFDGSILKVINISKGDVFDDCGGFDRFENGTVYPNNITQMHGEPSSGSSTTTPGSFVTIKFGTSDHGTSGLNLTEATLSDGELPDPPPYFNVFNGSVFVSRAPNKPEDPHPEDGAQILDRTGTAGVDLGIKVTDPDGNDMNVSFYNAETGDLIGKELNVASGGFGNTTWNGLTRGEDYKWYVKVTEAAGGSAVSDTFSFKMLTVAAWPNVTVNPRDERLRVGEDFKADINISLNETINVSKVELDVKFNKSFIEALSVSKGGLFDDTGGFDRFENGTIELGNVTGIWGNGTETSTSGIFATVDLRAIGAGIREIDLLHVNLSWNGKELSYFNVIDDTVKIEAPELIYLKGASDVPDAYVNQPYMAFFNLKNTGSYTANIVREDVESELDVELYPDLLNPGEVEPGEVEEFRVKSEKIDCGFINQTLNFTYMVSQGKGASPLKISEAPKIKNPLSLNTRINTDKRHAVPYNDPFYFLAIVSNKGRTTTEYSLNLSCPYKNDMKCIEGKVLVRAQTPQGDLYQDAITEEKFKINGDSKNALDFALIPVVTGKDGVIKLTLKGGCPEVRESILIKYRTQTRLGNLGLGYHAGDGLELLPLAVLPFLALVFIRKFRT